jgi:hypothetical protein
MMNNSSGDDLVLNRLFSYLQEELVIPIESIRPIRKNVYLIQSSNQKVVLKGFQQLGKLQIQKAFTSSLSQEGFKYTYNFQNLETELPLYLDGTFYGCLEYIPLSSRPFSFESEEERKEGLFLLDEFHQTTRKLSGRYRTVLKEYNPLLKWRERAARFINNLSIIKFFVQKEILNEIMEWADFSLKGMELEQGFLKDHDEAILHGDLAHHNFIRGLDNQLYIIDFDLISIGNPVCDYLQYCNRILPNLEWSLQDLIKYEHIQPYLQEPGFLYALLFPTDIFREWNRLVRNRQYMNAFQVRQVLDLTIRQFFIRQSFVKEVKLLLEA